MLSAILFILSALFLPGLIIRTKSILSGRKGPGILQSWKNIWVLLKKGSVFSTSGSIIMFIGPTMFLISILVATLTLPFDKTGAILSFHGDFLLFIYLLAFGKFMLIITALDAGSSFQGMGANREAFYSMLTEPSLFILIAAWSLLTGNYSFAEIFANLEAFETNNILIGILSVFLLIQIALVENSRLPVDDPKTHLELTMVHEVMILDVSGIDLALIQIGNAFKIAIFGSLIANAIIPGNLSLLYKIGIFIIVQVLYGIAIGFSESFRPRNKMAKNPKYLLSLSAIALIIFIMVYVIKFQLIS